MDMLTYNDKDASSATLWDTGSAGVIILKLIDHSIWLEDPAGDYYV